MYTMYKKEKQEKNRDFSIEDYSNFYIYVVFKMENISLSFNSKSYIKQFIYVNSI